ncbi:MAG: hypothetical protein EA364_05810 [Balneolaceae bacterium]|nr:MAG: hypothetical protein EA364_05810 [Balneolaceae bacterium]
MHNRFTPVIIALLFLTVACSKVPQKDWPHAVPADTPALILAEPGTSLAVLLQKQYMNLFDEMSSASILLFSGLDQNFLARTEVKAVLLYPNKNSDWQPVFIGTSTSDLLRKTAMLYQRPFTENQYRFEGVTVYRLFVDNRVFFGAQLRNWIVISESSYGVEESIRSYTGLKEPMNISGTMHTRGEIILNTPHFDRLISQIAAVRYKPAIEDIFKGTGIGRLQIGTFTTARQADRENIRINGHIPLADGNRSNMVSAISNENIPLTLDRYIPSDAAAFAIFNAPASGRLQPGFEPETRLDSLLSRDPGLFASLATTISTEFAFTAFYTAGFISETENAYLRRMSNSPEFFRLINRLANDGYIIRNNNAFYVRSKMLAVLLGSPFCHYEEFYLLDAGEAAILSPRLGLAQRLRGDFTRRRVMHFDERYSGMRRNLPDEMSGFIYMNSSNFMSYVAPMLAQNNFLGALTSQFDIATVSLQLNSSRNGIEFDLRTHQLERSEEPYQDLWVYPLEEADLTGKPLQADISGNNRDEVLFATSNGDVLALATDGSILFQARTGADIPIGSPIVYDWYANNQKAVIMAAGNKIYAWNNRGVLLPNFPFTLPEDITAPIEIADITRSGLPEVIVTTADRKVHILNGRGQNITGWPQNVNARVLTKPVAANIGGRWGIWAIAENTIHAWEVNGNPRTNYPFFASSSLNGSPVFINNTLLTGTADGKVLALGEIPLFSDTLATVRPYLPDLNAGGYTISDSQPGLNTTPGFSAQYIQVANSPVTVAGVPHNVRLRDEFNKVNSETVFIVQSGNGSVFLYNRSGHLRHVKSTGQSASSEELPFLIDINSDGWHELIAVAGFGRLYGWDLNRDERLENLPSAGMKFPVIHDLIGDGSKNLIAQTRDGLRCWRINLK